MDVNDHSPMFICIVKNTPSPTPKKETKGGNGLIFTVSAKIHAHNFPNPRDQHKTETAFHFRILKKK